MHRIQLTLGIVVLFSIICYSSSTNKGLTWKPLVWPSAPKNWAGKWGCSGCNPYHGDTDCTEQHPIFCILAHKTLPRPYYYYPSSYSSAIADKGFYNGWSGGIFGVTQTHVQGLKITSKKVGDQICADELGSGWQMMAHGMSWYMPYMNNPPVKEMGTWDWSNVKSGGWYSWGYFAHHYQNKAWTWINDQKHGNCDL